MKKLLFIMTVVVGTVAALQLFPGERRARLKERLREIEERMPPVVMMSSMRRCEEQNDQLVALMRKQNKLLRKQNQILQAVEDRLESQS